MTISRNLLVCAVAVALATAVGPNVFFQGQMADAQQMSGAISAAVNASVFLSSDVSRTEL